MRDKIRFCFLPGVVFVLVNCSCIFGQTEEPNVVDIYNHYKDSLSWTKFVSMRMEVVLDLDEMPELYKNNRRDFIFRRDHDRAEWIGQFLIFDSNGDIYPYGSRVIKHISTGKVFWSIERGILAFSPSKVFHTAVKAKDCKVALENTLGRSVMGAALFGKSFSGTDGKGIIKLLGESQNLNLRDSMEAIKGVSCHVLEGITDYGKVTAWIAPEKGYSALKWVFEKTPEVMFDGKRLSDIWPEIQSTADVFDSVEMEQVSDNDGKAVFIPCKARYASEVVFINGKKTVNEVNYTVSAIQLNPDFDALGAFKVDFPNDTRVRIEEYPGVRYKWQNGKIVPDVDAPTFEEIDAIVENLKASPADSNEN